MKRAVAVNPLTLGCGFSTWSSVRLGAHLAKVTGLRFGDDQLRRLLHRKGFSIHRPKHTLKGKRDEAAYEKAKKRLVRLKKKR
jgi:transposase